MKTNYKFDNIIIHNFPKENFMQVLINFRSGNKIILSMCMKDIESFYSYLERQNYFNGTKYRVINHKRKM